jgi:hypothetical protein
MDDLYDKLKEDVQFRKMWAEKCGFGFELASVVPNYRKSPKKLKHKRQCKQLKSERKDGRP